MVCYTRNSRDFAPGCVGGETLGDGVDVCIFRENNPTPSPTRAPTPYPTFPPGSVPSGTFKLKLYWDNYNWQEVGAFSSVLMQRLPTFWFLLLADNALLACLFCRVQEDFESKFS